MSKVTQAEWPKHGFDYLVLDTTDLTAEEITLMLNEHAKRAWRVVEIIGNRIYMEVYQPFFHCEFVGQATDRLQSDA
jgi:hypothetical protein